MATRRSVWVEAVPTFQGKSSPFGARKMGHPAIFVPVDLYVPDMRHSRGESGDSPSRGPRSHPLFS